MLSYQPKMADFVIFLFIHDSISIDIVSSRGRVQGPVYAYTWQSSRSCEGLTRIGTLTICSIVKIRYTNILIYRYSSNSLTVFANCEMGRLLLLITIITEEPFVLLVLSLTVHCLNSRLKAYEKGKIDT